MFGGAAEEQMEGGDSISSINHGSMYEMHDNLMKVSSSANNPKEQEYETNFRS